MVCTFSAGPLTSGRDVKEALVKRGETGQWPVEEWAPHDSRLARTLALPEEADLLVLWEGERPREPSCSTGPYAPIPLCDTMPKPVLKNSVELSILATFHRS